MLKRLGVQIRNQWAGFLSLFLVLAGGTAYAANTVFSGDIADGQVKTVDLANAAVTVDKIANGAVTSDKVKDDTLLGRDVAANTLKGADIDESTLAGLGGGSGGTGARAYGYVTKNGLINRSKNVVGDAAGVGGGPVAGGSFCITLAGSIDASTAVIVAAPDYAHDDTSGSGGSTITIVESDSSGDCGGNTVMVQTAAFVGDGVDDGAGDGDFINNTNQPFYFVVP